MKYFYSEKWEEDNYYHICFTDDLYDKLRPFYNPAGMNSYFNLFYRLFGLLPNNFFQYIQVTFNAKIKIDKPLQFVTFYFQTKSEAEKFITELNRRMAWVKEFKE